MSTPLQLDRLFCAASRRNFTILASLATLLVAGGVWASANNQSPLVAPYGAAYGYGTCEGGEGKGDLSPCATPVPRTGAASAGGSAKLIEIAVQPTY
jgi:hypothetical protein